MAHLISFRTARFDVAEETPNPINPIPGQSVLLWLRDEIAKAQYRTSEPDTEDWGWYIDVEGAEGSYLVGASGDAEGSTPDLDWIVQVSKVRSLKERLFGRNRMALDDPLFTLIERVVRADPTIEQVSVDKNA
jgi:hypothetical protein